MKQYGNYRVFEHQPTEEEVSEAVESIVEELMPYIKKSRHSQMQRLGK